MDADQIYKKIRLDNNVDTFDPKAVRVWVASHRPDLVGQFDEIFDETDHRKHVDSLRLLISIGFGAGRAYERNK